MRDLRAFAGLAGLVLLLGPGCAAQGDFGRQERTVVSETVAPYAGSVIARGREEAVSDFMMTDAEKGLRERAYHFLMPAHPRSQFDSFLTELARTRILPTTRAPLDPPSYFSALMSESWRSSGSPYRRLASDIEADIALVDPFFAQALIVAQTDSVREQSLARIPDLQDAERDNALARIGENRALVRWVKARLEERVAAYRYALHRLVIEIPEREAITSERLLAVLEDRAGLAMAGGISAKAGARYLPGRNGGALISK